MTTLTFANPEWLWCLLLLPPLALLRFWAQFRGKRGAPGLVSPRLRSELIVGAAQWKRWVIFSVQLAALALLLAALARPQWGYEDSEIESEGRNVFVAIDTSRSMQARDLLPDRLTRAKLAALDIVEALPADRIGLIAFAGKAFLQAPLTVDHDAVSETIRQFDTELIPRGGTNLASAVRLAIETLENAESEASALILFSDGENLEGEEEIDRLRERAGKVGLVLVAVGVGTVPGELIPELDEKGREKPGEFVTDDEDNVVRSRLDPEALKDLSQRIGGGAYVNLGATASVSKVVTDAIDNIEAVRQSGDARRRPIERFMWPLGAALALFLIAWLLPGTLRAFAFLFTPQSAGRNRDAHRAPPPPPPGGKDGAASAAVLGVVIYVGTAGLSVAQSSGAGESAGYDALQRESFGPAIEAYEKELEQEKLAAEKSAWLNLGLGSAAYRSGDFEKAKAAFGKALEYQAGNRLETQAHYNLANALFRSGEKLLGGPAGSNPDLPRLDGSANKEQVAEQWRSAIEHYEAALLADAANQQSKHNLGVVKKRLELLLQEPPEQEQQDQEDEPNEDEEEPEENQQQSNSQDQPQDPNAGNPDPENQQDPENGKDDPAKPPPTDPNNNDSPQPPPDQPPNPTDQPPQQPDQPDPDGKLDAQPDQPDSRPPNQTQPPEPHEVNPETGFSPEEARQKLRTLSDEDLEVRPALPVPVRAERFKNW